MIPTNLTELTAQDLNRLSTIIDGQIQEYESAIELCRKWVPDGETFERVTAKDNVYLSSLRQLHVLLLNALTLVRQRESVISN